MSESVETREQRLAGIRERAEGYWNEVVAHQDKTATDALVAFADSESERHLIELNKALELSVTVPPDILAEMLTPPVCGVSKTSTSLGLAAATMGGCGKEIRDPRECSRCVDCKVPFHLNCLKNHCKSELAAERERVLLEAAKAVCQGCRDEIAVQEKDSVATANGDPFWHYVEQFDVWAICDAAAIHDLRSKGESR